MIQTIHRSLVGIALIAFSALLLISLLIAGIWITFTNGTLTPNLFSIFGLGIVVTILIAYVSGYVYWLSVIEVSPDKIVVVRWFSLFSSRQAEAEWRDVEDITIRQGDILSQLFSFGVITVETAGTKPNLTISYIADVQELQAQLMAFVDKARASGE